MKNTGTNIKQTLKKKLFINPTFEGDKEIYKELFGFIFPGYTDFINFLDETNHEKIIEYSKKILLRLSYEELFPPPTKLLINLLDSEEEQIKDDKSHYVHKDHFVHIVHLYIFGIYLYLYHKGLKLKINNFFQDLRYKRSKYTNAKKKNFRDFVIGWRHFALFHDLAYPLQNKELVKEKQYIEPFEKINKYLMKDLNIKYLSNLFIIYQLFSNTKTTKENRFDYLFLSRFGKETNEKNEIIRYKLPVHLKEFEEYKTYVKINNLEGKTIEFLFACLQNEKIMSVLVETFSGEPIAFLLTFKNNCKVIYINENERSKKIFSLFYDETNKCFIHGNSNYYWVHFVTDTLVKSKSCIYDFFDNNNKKILADLSKTMYDELKTEISLLPSKDSHDNFCYENYIMFYNDYGYLSPETKNELKDDIYFNNLNKALSPLNIEIPEKISAYVKSFLEKYFKKNKIIKLFTKYENMNVFISYILSELNNEKFIKEMEDELNKSTENNIKKVINLSKLKKYNDDYFTEIYKKEIFKDILKMELINIENIFNNLNLDEFKNHIKNNYKIEYSDIIEKYKPSHSKDNSKYYDHGFYGSLLYFTVQNFYIGLLKEEKSNNKMNKYLRLSFGNNINNYNYIKYNHLINEIGFAIFVHNIYPVELKSSLKTKNFVNIQINSNPFAYFCLLADSLQPWDRKYSMKHGNINLPYLTCSNSFDIIISDSKIKIIEKSASLNIKERLKSLKENLDSYLKNASSLIEIDLSNWS